MAAPLFPLLALGSLGLVAHFTMKPRPRSGTQPSRLPSRPSELIDPWASAPPLPPPPPSNLIDPWATPPPAPPPAPVRGASAPLPAPTPPTPVQTPVAAPLPPPQPSTRDSDVLRDVNNMLTSDAPPPPPVVPAPVVAPTPVANTPAPPVLVMPPPSPTPAPVVLPKPAPTPVVVVTPQPATPTPQEPTMMQPPPGFSPVAAKAQAARVAANLRKGRDQYSRPNLASWQRLAGLTADGIYGGESAGALAWYLQGQSSVAPRPFFKPTTPAPYRLSSQATAILASVRAAS